MNILMVAQFAIPIIGGEEQHIINLSNELVRRGHRVAIATIKHSQQSNFEIHDGIRIYRLQGTFERVNTLFSDDTRRHAPPFPDPEIVSGLRHVMALEKPDIIHAHNWLSYSYLPLARKGKSGFIVTLHDYCLRCATKRFMYRGSPCSGPAVFKCIACSSEHYGPLRGAPIYLANQAMSAIERNCVDMFLAVSQVTAVNNGLVGSKLPYQVIPNFFPDELVDEPDDHVSLLEKLPQGDFLLFVGDLSREKGIAVLLESHRELNSTLPLVLIGRSTSDTPTQLPENVSYLGPWPHSAVMQAWKRCCLALAPSVWPEPFGMVVIEAMSAGCTIIATNTGGIPDIIQDGVSGMLVPPGDSEALKQMIQLLLSSPDRRKQLGEAAKFHSRDFLASTVVPRIEQVYQSILERN